jgi:co-chaperonin GroES (HSP10)
MRIDQKRYAMHATAQEAKAAMLADLLPIVADIDVMRNRVLVATYHRPEKTTGGIILVDDTLNEEKWQGKTGLVLKVGPVAFQFDEVLEEMSTNGGDAQAAHEVHRLPTVGDWVHFRNSDAWDVAIRVAPGIGVHCRIIDDACIVGKITDPAMIW